jgi:hypothetical protein
MPITKSQFRESVAVRNVITAEKVRLGELKSDIKITDIKNIDIGKAKDMGTGALLIEYEYKVELGLSEPKNQSLGKIVIIGELIYVEDSKLTNDILSDWKKDKKVRPAFMQEVLNYALREAQIEALEQSKKVMLPPPVPLPKIRPKASKAS